MGFWDRVLITEDMLALSNEELVKVAHANVLIVTEGSGMSEEEMYSSIAKSIRHRFNWQQDLRQKTLDAIDKRRTEATQLKWFGEYASSLDSDERMPRVIGLLAMLEPPTFWKAIKQWLCMRAAIWEYNDRLLELMRRHADIAPVRKNNVRRTKVRVYRGCSRPRVKGISWTTDRDVASDFAHGHRMIPVPDPVIAAASVSTKDIFVRIHSRGEKVLDPIALFDLDVQVYG